jgi:hypothetical protein
MLSERIQRLVRLLWPSFVVAAIGEAIFFTVFDPFELHFFGAPLELPRLAIYTMGFFGFWGLGAASSMLSAFLERAAAEVNRCPLGAPDRPLGCPKRDERGSTQQSASRSASRQQR